MNIEEKCRQKTYLYDLYRWSGSISRKSFWKALMQPKYRIVFLKRMCESRREKGKLRFLFWRGLYEHYMVKYGVDIAATTQIGPGFIVQHLGGIAINKGAVLGKNVEILQGVTIGYERRGKRQGCPTIGDNVWIGSHAIIVGKVQVGSHVLIAPGAFVNFDVPDHSIVLGNPGRIIPRDDAVAGYVTNVPAWDDAGVSAGDEESSS